MYMEFTEKRGHICEKGPVIRLHGNNSSIPSLKESDVIFLGNYTLRKGKYLNIFLGLLNTVSKMTLIFGHLKDYHVSPV